MYFIKLLCGKMINFDHVDICEKTKSGDLAVYYSSVKKPIVYDCTPQEHRIIEEHLLSNNKKPIKIKYSGADEDFKSFLLQNIERKRGFSLTRREIEAEYLEYCKSKDKRPLKITWPLLRKYLYNLFLSSESHSIRKDGKTVNGFSGIRLKPLLSNVSPCKDCPDRNNLEKRDKGKGRFTNECIDNCKRLHEWQKLEADNLKLGNAKIGV